jgi:hypothetical protein
VYSLGPVGQNVAEALPLEAFVNFGPGTGGAASGAFRFSDELGALLAPPAALAQGLPPRLLLFSVVSTAPAAKKTVSDAPTVSDDGAVVVTVREVVQADLEGKSLTVALEAADGTALEPHVLSFSAMSPSDLLTVRKWERSELVSAVRECTTVPARLLPSVTTTLEAMLASYGGDHLEAGEPEYRPPAGDAEQLAALEWMATAQWAVKAWESHGASGWQLTPRGRELLQVRFSISKAWPLLRPREEAREAGASGLSAASAWELLCFLSERGWACRAVGHGKQARAQALPYRGVGCPRAEGDGEPAPAKLWYLSPGARSIPRLYLVALLLAEAGEIKVPVEHLQTQMYYSCVIAGQEYRPRARGRQREGDFVLVDSRSSWAPVQAARKRARPRRDQSETEPSETEAEEAESLVSGSPRSQGSPSTSSSSSSASSSTSSSPDSSDGDDARGRGGVGGASAPPAPPAAAAPSPSLAPPAEAAAGAGGPLNAARLDDGSGTSTWKGYKCTPVFGPEGHRGWEFTCYRHGRREGRLRRPLCTRTLRFAFGSAESKALTLTRLRWWAWEGPKHDTRAEHMSLCHHPDVGAMPTLEELEAWTPPELP